MKDTKTEIKFFSVPEWKKEEKLDMMKRVFTGRMLPLLTIFFLIIIPQIIMQGHMDTPLNHGLMVFFCVMFVIYLGIFAAFAVPFWKYYKSVHKK